MKILDYCASCGNLIKMGDPLRMIRGQMIDGWAAPWPVCSRCWVKHWKNKEQSNEKVS